MSPKSKGNSIAVEGMSLSECDECLASYGTLSWTALF